MEKSYSGRSEAVEIFNKYKSKIYGLALSITHNEDDAKDIVQNTFVKIIDNLKNFRNESNISTWVYKIAYNEAMMSLRKKSRDFKYKKILKQQESRVPIGLFIDWSKLPDELVIDEEIKERVDDAIRRLPIKYRMALILHNIDDLSLKETAQILKLKENSLKTRLHRGYLKIKDEINRYLKDAEAGKPRPEDFESSPRCGIMTGFVLDYARGSLGKERKRGFDKHINDCRNCKDFLKSYSQAIAFTDALCCRDIPYELSKKIESFLLKKVKP